MSKKENLKKNLKSGKRRASRSVALDETTRDQLLKVVLEKTLVAKAKPKPTPTQKTSDVFGDLIAFLLQSDLEAEPEHLVEGIMQALESGILSGNFVAPAKATVLGWVKSQMKAQTEDLEEVSTKVETAEISTTGAIEALRGDPGPFAGSNSTDDPLDAVPF